MTAMVSPARIAEVMGLRGKVRSLSELYLLCAMDCPNLP